MATVSINGEEDQVNIHGKEEVGTSTTQTSGILQAQYVLCDSCMESPGRALKSCLTCLVSYCEAHLRPHLEKAKFQNHRLVDPLHDIEHQACDVHQLPLERFCLTDCCCVCRDCESQEHEGHATTSLGEARTQIENELPEKEKEISQSVSKAETAFGKLQRNKEQYNSAVQEVVVITEQQFMKLQMTVEEARKGVAEVLEKELKQALRQAEGIQAHLEQRRVELMKTLAQLNKLCKTKSDVDFLQEYAEKKKGMPDISVPSVTISRLDHLTSYAQVVTDTTQELCSLILTSYSENLRKICKRGTQSLMPACHLSSLPDPKTQEGFLKYQRSLKFDPDTAHHFLRIMEECRKLTNTSPWQHSYPDHPDRFEYWRQAMTSESLYLGRHYIEAELSGEGAHVGVAYRSIARKGDQSSSCITGNSFSWCMGRNSRGFSAWHDGVETALDVTGITRIGLYIDFHKCTLSFYNASGPMMLLHTYTADLIEPLYVTAWLSKKDNIVCLVNAK
ncbi:tripartite motif-containing protein 16-like [Pholidichthys leucotaenia]